MKKTTYIIDTSVIIASPFFFKDLSKAEIIIPIVVISELDKLKKFPNEVGKSARVFIKYLDTISEKIDLSIGVAVENNLTFKVDVNNYNNDFGDPNYGDNKILACANDWNQKQKNVYLLTNDFNLRIRARSLAIQASRFEASNTIITELYSGFKEVKSYEAAEMLLMEGEIEAADFQIVNLQPNQFVIFLDENEDIAAIRQLSYEAFYTYIAVTNRQHIFEKAIKAQLKVNPHPSNKYRTNCPLTRLKLFRSIYNIVKGDKMYWHNTDTIW